MKKGFTSVVLCITLLAGTAFASYQYKAKGEHEGKDITPSEAYEMILKDPNAVIVDTRTQAEYQFVGHPTNAYNIPYKFWNGKLEEKGYGMTNNPDYEKNLIAQFNPAKHKLIFMCRSGKRSCLACTTAISAGWDPQNVYNMLGGFEGDKLNNPQSNYNGQRVLGGWKNEGLPWTYSIDKKYVYQPDISR